MQFFVDENNLNAHYFICRPTAKLKFEKSEKPYFSYLLRKEKNSAFQTLEDVLINSGFERHMTLKGYDLITERIYEKTSPAAEIMMKSLKNGGFELRMPEEREYSALWNFIDTIDEIPFWDKTFPTTEEFVDDIRNGYVKCIYDPEGEIVAAGYAFMEGIYEYGWIAVKKEYRKFGAMAVVLTNEKVKRMLENGNKGRAWVSIDNNASLNYHEKLGYAHNGRFREIYLLNQNYGG